MRDILLHDSFWIKKRIHTDKTNTVFQTHFRKLPVQLLRQHCAVSVKIFFERVRPHLRHCGIAVFTSQKQIQIRKRVFVCEVRRIKLIYFDNGATTLPKPREVYKAVEKALCMGNPGRGGHRKAMEGARALFGAREVIAEHFGAEKPEQVCFFYNATTALNCVIKMIMARGGKLLISDMEHNAVRRPALSVERQGGKLGYFCGYGSEEEICDSFEKQIDGDTLLAVFIYTSNICPAELPVRKLADICRRHGVLSLIDCAQAGGHFPISLAHIGADGLIFPSHKGLFGIAGGGVLVCSEALKSALEEAPTVMEGGSGVLSFEKEMPGDLPERLEWGTGALPVVLSIVAGIKFIEKIGYEQILYQERLLFRKCIEGLGNINGITLHGMKMLAEGDRIETSNQAPNQIFRHGGPLLLTSKHMSNERLSALLSEKGVCVREGFHCAPIAHQTVGTGQTGGIRVSFSLFNTPREVDCFLMLLQKLSVV